MINGVHQDDLWSFGQLYSILVEFADDPAKAIMRSGGGRISIPEDLANHLDVHYWLLREKYPDSPNLEVMQVVAKFESILSDKSHDGASFDEWFWTNAGFQRHPDWDTIRELSRAFLLRTG